MDIDIYRKYFEADCVFNGVKRKGALVTLTSRSGGGEITYAAAVSFFPHVSQDDFAVSYDAYAEKVLFSGKGRRSKKRESAFLGELEAHVDEAAAEIGGKVYWDRPIER